jgi:signal transduction histidine kinase
MDAPVRGALIPAEPTLTDQDIGSETAQGEEAALGEFLRLVVPLAVFFGSLQAVVGWWLRDASMELMALLIALYGACLLEAKVLFDQGHPRASVLWIAGGLAIPTLAGMWLQPSMLPVGSLLPLMALAAALPFVTPRRMRAVLLGSVAWELAIGLIATLAPPPRDPAPWYGDLFVISTMACAAFVTALLWMRYRERLVRAREREHEITEQLRQVDRLKTTLLRAASHDLRTPTAAILGAARTLEHLALDTQDSRALIASISRGATRLAGLLDDLLDAETLHLGTVELSAHASDLADVVGDVVPKLELRDRRLVVDLQPAYAILDERKVGRVVENLVTNSLRHAGAEATVWVRVRSNADGAELIVEDDGPGIPAGDRDRIFEPFRRGETDTPGSGLGLSIVAGFVDLHGGRVWVEDRPGGGASFHAMFPRARDVAPARPLASPVAADRTA